MFSYFRFFRMFLKRFDHLPIIAKQDTTYRRRSFLPNATRYLATGESQVSLIFSFRIGKNTVSKILSETCDAIYQVLCNTYLKPPQSATGCSSIASGFKELWNLSFEPINMSLVQQMGNTFALNVHVTLALLTITTNDLTLCIRHKHYSHKNIPSVKPSATSIASQAFSTLSFSIKPASALSSPWWELSLNSYCRPDSLLS